MSSALTIITILLKLAAFLARRVERADIEKAILNEVEKIHKDRVDAAVDAGDRVRSGGVPADPDDPYRRKD